MSEAIKPRLWSDFDGTAVAIAKKTNPRNWSKYPLPVISGYPDFLRGVADTGLVEFAGFVSRRPNIPPRRWATMRSISSLGINSSFTGNERVILTGSEQAKGQFLANETRGRSVVGMVEDKPHKLGPIIAGALRNAFLHELNPYHGVVVLGVVAHAKSEDYIERLLSDVDKVVPNAQVNSYGDGAHQIYPTFSDGPRIDVVPLQPYSEEAGVAFAERLAQTA